MSKITPNSRNPSAAANKSTANPSNVDKGTTNASKVGKAATNPSNVSKGTAKSAKIAPGEKNPSNAAPCPPDAANTAPGASKVDQETASFFICGNWKMNGDKKSIPEIVAAITEDHAKKTQIVLAVPSCYLDFVKCLAAPGVSIGAQNIFHEDSGAFTGEVSAEMVKDCGAEWVIAGSSERRGLFAETDECTAKKIAKALCASLKVIICIGETKAEREHGHTHEVLARQLLCVKSSMECRCGSPVVIAYEPVWSFKTGISCSIEEAQETHAFIREWLKTNISEDVAGKTKLLYGGSVTSENAAELQKQNDIDGFYIGEESFSTNFVKILKSCKCGC